ncbi:MAG: pitrilysin family protein [Bacteroidales bacterium]|nr:pitrilysin family protein [Bacteroidales bacterium]MDD4669887.1 pitrilysin family protein [Bacteroidales bacterium]
MNISEHKPYIKEFSCGLTFAFKRSSSQVAYCALSIKSGTRNEPAQYNGIAHLAEHVLFKGTQHRTSTEINNRLEKLGGELNAYTTKEETVIYSTVLKEDITKSADLLFELAFTSTFPEKELKKERSVVIDEINMYKDSPSDYIFDDFEEFVFGDHPLSRSILGSSRTLNKISSETIQNYVKTNFLPQNMSFTIVADLTDEKAEKIVKDCIKKYVPECSTVTGNSLTAVNRAEETLAPGIVFTKEVSKKNHQVNCIIGSTAYSLYDKRRITLILLSNILGGPSSNSFLNQVLREKGALVYTVEASYTPYSDNGILMIYFGCDKVNLRKCLDLTHREISKLRDKKLSESFLKAAKKQLLGQLTISSDNGESQSLSMGKSLISYKDIMSDEIVREQINSITSEDIFKVANEILSADRISTLIYK